MSPTEECSGLTSPALEDLLFSFNENCTQVSAVVEFTNPLDVLAAIAALDGQLYGDVAIRAEQAPQPLSMSPRAEFDAHLETGSGAYTSSTIDGGLVSSKTLNISLNLSLLPSR
jgi:hypothetical protein